MKFIGKAFLVLVFILLFIPFLFATSAKFQFLSPDFWINSFRAGDVYPKLETVLSKELQRQVKAGGTSAQEARLWTGILSSGTIKDLVEKNLKLTLDFANGKEKEQKFYIPFEKLPKGLLPADVSATTGNTISPADLAKLLSPQGGQTQIQNQSLARGGANALISWIVSLILLLGVLILVYLITGPGQRLTTAGIGLILSSLLTMAIVTLGNLWSKGAASLTSEAEPAAQLLVTLAPPVMKSMFALWRNIAFGTLILGIVLLFVKKPLGVAKKTVKKTTKK
jgi:hypothetical protein